MAEPTLSWNIGSVRVTRVEERVHGVPRDTLVPGITDAHLAEHADWVGPYFSGSGKLLVSVHSFVVEDGVTTIVVDTCAGAEPERPLPGDAAFLGRLSEALPGGLAGVDVVLCTHLHFDHVGWNTRVVDGRRVPTFPNARYLFAEAELASLDEDDHLGVHEPAIAPLLEAGQVDLVDPSHAITSHVRLVPTPGHTPGHVSVVIESAGEAGVITGDVLHTPLQFAEPQLTATPFDWDSAQATRTRERFIAEHVDRGRLILGTHFPPPTGGRLVQKGGRARFVAPPAGDDADG